MKQTIKFTVAIGVIFALIFSAGARTQTQNRKLKIYISVDMEGVAGVVTQDQLTPEGFEYNRFREFMTQETNAAIKAAQNAGATEIVVSDSHGNGENLLIEELPADVTLVRSWPRPLMMMQGIDETFDGAIFIGYHASTNNTEGVRAHTISSAHLTDIKLNGTSMPEAGINAAIAGDFNVPIIMISGDDAIAKEATALLGNIEAATVKWNYGFHSARSLTPKASCDIIAEKVRAAMARIKEFKPYKVSHPVQLDVTFKNYRPAELLSYLSIVKRIDSHSIRFVGKDMTEVSKFLEFINSYDQNLTP
ncbi:MAG TPA: M55 family metallopeptidase [Blastocatellia bacterium]|nr:M55 family metallopeptidase [Blastocatellia bacterium]